MRLAFFPAALLDASRQTSLVVAMVPVIAGIIGAHCASTRARDEFVQAYLRAGWTEAQAMVQGMLAEPWHLIGHLEVGFASSSNCCRSCRARRGGWRSPTALRPNAHAT